MTEKQVGEILPMVTRDRPDPLAAMRLLREARLPSVG